jgi:hypothetical protein
VLVLAVSSIFILTINGCGSSYQWPTRPSEHYVVGVNSIALPDTDLGKKTYVLTSAMKNVSEGDLQFKEFARYIENALSITGYKRINNENEDLIIRFAYGIGSPKTEVSTQTYTTSTGYSYPILWSWVHVPPQTETVTTKTTTYDRFLIVEAYDAKDKRSQLWKTTVTSSGYSSDLRIVLPHMIATAVFYFGANTKGQLLKSMAENSGRTLGIMRMKPFFASPKVTFTEKEQRFGVKVEPLTYGNKLFYRSQYLKAGILVTAVAENSVAQKMGIQQYDVILAVNKKTVDNVEIFLEEVQKTKQGGKIKITFYNWEKSQEVSKEDYLN